MVKIENFNNYRRFLIKRVRINQQIKSSEVQLIDESGKSLGTLKLNEALEIASERNYDLVEVSANVNPPVCRLMDYGKYKYQQIKKEHKQKKQSKQKELKNIRLSARIEDHDFGIKVKKAENFLTKGHKVKVILILKGREAAYTDRGLEIINEFVNSLEKNCKDKEGPTRERNTFQIILTPKR